MKTLRHGGGDIGGHRVVGEERLPPSRRQLVDLVGRMGGNTQQDVGQPDAVFDALHPAGGEQAVDDPDVCGTEFAPGKMLNSTFCLLDRVPVIDPGQPLAPMAFAVVFPDPVYPLLVGEHGEDCASLEHSSPIGPIPICRFS